MGSLRPSIEFDLLSLVVVITVMMVMVNTIMVMMMLEDDHDISKPFQESFVQQVISVNM